MTTLLYTHSVCQEHEAGPHHPESPERLKAISTALEAEEFTFLQRREAPLGTVEQIARQHPKALIDSVLNNIPTAGYHYIDGDTAMNPMSGEAALRAVGGICEAVDEVMTGKARNAFCATRPPGHHAERYQSMGFCLFNNVAIGAAHAHHVYGVEKVAIVDFDVHHGNGSQDMAEQNAYMFYASSHQSPCYPGTGFERETGLNGNVVNVELAPGSGSEAFREGYEAKIFPKLRAFAPDLLMISAGFDAHARDPLAHLRLQTDDFEWVSRELLKIAGECCEGKVVSQLEGGYDLTALADSVAVHVRVLMGN